MKRLLAALALAACSSPEKVADPLKYVSPFMGTGGFAFQAGSAFPGASVPNGLAKVGPDTEGKYGYLIFLDYSGYWYGDDRVQGFSHLHLHGTGATDYGVLTVMPLPDFKPGMQRVKGYESKFDKETEVATPGYYAVTLDKGTIRAEMTATTHCAEHRWTFGADAAKRFMLVDLGKMIPDGKITASKVTLDPATGAFEGMVHANGAMSGGFGGYDVFFTGQTNGKWKATQIWKGDSDPEPGTTLDVEKGGFVVEFEGGDRIDLRLGLSLVSLKGAKANLAAEIPALNFDVVKQAAEVSWQKRIGAVTVYGGSVDDRTNFYSALRLAFMMPSVIADADGSFRYGGKADKDPSFHMQSDFSLWDTYRSVHPLYGLLAPDVALDSVQSLIAMHRLGGALPRWALATGDTGVMLGAPAEIVIADAYMRGIRGFDAGAAFEFMRAAALDPDPPGGRGPRDSFGTYLTTGFVPITEDGRSVSKTMEYNHSDFALSNLGRALGKTEAADRLLTRSRGYRKLWDAPTKTVRAKNPDGTPAPGPFDPKVWTNFAEANAFQSVWMAPHDIDGLVGLFGGRDAFTSELEGFFEKAIPDFEARQAMPYEQRWIDPPLYYWAGNEPDIHAPFLFAQAGRPDLTAKWSVWARNTFFNATSEGLPGNDDGGAMGSWYVLAALGLYPIPGSDVWIVGSPMFPKTEIAVSGGVFTIEAEDVSAENIYVQSAELNGETLDVATIHHTDLKAGGSLVLEMGPEPSKWAQ